MSENGEIYTTGKNFTLPPALTAWTNSTSVIINMVLILAYRAMLSKRTILLGIAEVLNLREYGQTLSQAGPSRSCAIILLTGLHLRFRDTRSPVPMFIAIILDFPIVITKHNHIRHQMVLSFATRYTTCKGGRG